MVAMAAIMRGSISNMKRKQTLAHKRINVSIWRMARSAQYGTRGAAQNGAANNK